MTMLDLLLLTVVFLSIWIVILLRKAIINERRANLTRVKFPQNWLFLLQTEVYLYRQLPESYKPELHKHIKIFLAEKKFIGQNGFVITLKVKLTIASTACILLLGDKLGQRNYFPYLKYIYVYPSHIELKNHRHQNSALLLGQSSVGNKSGHDGVISLSWVQVASEALAKHQTENVILHEFAHQLDQEFGTATGMPRLTTIEDTVIWGKIFAHEYLQLTQAVKQNRSTIINSYGATNPVEFFAVVTETFFIKSQLLATYHPLLYQQLQKYYGVNPVDWK